MVNRLIVSLCCILFSHQVVSDVEVLEIEQLSPTVKGYTLAVKNTHLKFHPGQWYATLEAICTRLHNLLNLTTYIVKHHTP